MKRYANRRLRRIKIEDTLADGKAYRKYTNPWDISDWSWLYYTEQEVDAHVEWLWGIYNQKTRNKYKSFKHFREYRKASLRCK